MSDCKAVKSIFFSDRLFIVTGSSWKIGDKDRAFRGHRSRGWMVKKSGESLCLSIGDKEFKILIEIGEMSRTTGLFLGVHRSSSRLLFILIIICVKAFSEVFLVLSLD